MTGFQSKKNNTISVVHTAYSQLDAQTTCFGLTNLSSGAFIQDKQQWNAMTRQDQYFHCVFIVWDPTRQMIITINYNSYKYINIKINKTGNMRMT